MNFSNHAPWIPHLTLYEFLILPSINSSCHLSWILHKTLYEHPITLYYLFIPPRWFSHTTLCKFVIHLSMIYNSLFPLYEFMILYSINYFVTLYKFLILPSMNSFNLICIPNSTIKSFTYIQHYFWKFLKSVKIKICKLKITHNSLVY